MSDPKDIVERVEGGPATETAAPGDAWEGVPRGREGLRMRVRTIEPVTIVRLEGCELLFEDTAIRTVHDRLHRLVEEGHTRLLVNLAGVRYFSSDLLGILAGLQKRVGPAGGHIRLCGLDPLLREMVRMAHLDRVLDVCADEAEALGLLIT
jgi:anti-sigma B factor antagonist